MNSIGRVRHERIGPKSSRPLTDDRYSDISLADAAMGVDMTDAALSLAALMSVAYLAFTLDWIGVVALLIVLVLAGLKPSQETK